MLAISFKTTTFIRLGKISLFMQSWKITISYFLLSKGAISVHVQVHITLGNCFPLLLPYLLNYSSQVLMSLIEDNQDVEDEEARQGRIVIMMVMMMMMIIARC